MSYLFGDKLEMEGHYRGQGWMERVPTGTTAFEGSGVLDCFQVVLDGVRESKRKEKSPSRRQN